MRKAAKTSITPDMRNSRRAVLIGIAATAAIIPAAAATALASLPGATDPAFLLIDTALQKHKAFSAAMSGIGVYPSDDPRTRAADALAGQRCGEDWDATENVAGCTPTTMAGVAAVLLFFAERMDRDAYCQQELIKTLLGSMATALDRIAAGRVS